MQMDADTGLHTNCTKLASLIGIWKGQGSGFFPTIKPFAYAETVEFLHAGKPVFSYNQKTTIGGQPMHAENGFLRVFPDQHLEFFIAQPTGPPSNWILC